MGNYRRDDLDCTCDDSIEEMEVSLRKALELRGEERRRVEEADAAKRLAERAV